MKPDIVLLYSLYYNISFTISHFKNDSFHDTKRDKSYQENSQQMQYSVNGYWSMKFLFFFCHCQFTTYVTNCHLSKRLHRNILVVFIINYYAKHSFAIQVTIQFYVQMQKTPFDP